ncbi:MAG: alpha-L-glutamate ligase-like protein [Luteolibacter sp.]|jgi:alpha-L-glutamate ligase-like protein
MNTTEASNPAPRHRWWSRWIRTPGELRAMGVIGINMRNGRFLLPNNPRKFFDRVDNKIHTKRLAVANELSVPETYATIESPHLAAKLPGMLADRDSFVIKPARGSGGKGVLVIDAQKDGLYYKPSGAALTKIDLRNHVSNILAGLFSLGGQRDFALVEQRIRPAKLLTDISYQGAPDIRIVLLHGYPVMAMLRAATRESDGRANLHQGAIGIGIDLATGVTFRAIHHGKTITHHPDIGIDLLGIQIPHWQQILEIAVVCQEMTELGYLGVDVMIDESVGPVMIEVNARPGLAIQMANGIGLLRRLGPVDERHRHNPSATAEEKIEFSIRNFAASHRELSL